MLNGDMETIWKAEDEILQDWEKNLIEWCFQYPEKDICGIYFKAMMNKNVRRRIHV